MSLPLDITIATRARALITKPENWCRLWFGEDAKGGAVRYSDLETEAKRLCAHGAILVAASEMIPDPNAADAIAARIVQQMVGADDECEGMERLWAINFKDGHPAVIRLFDRFIEGDAQ
jgi:hypothetical protein